MGTHRLRVSKRSYPIFGALVLYLFLSIWNGIRYAPSTHDTLFVSLLYFGFPACVALLFLIVGGMVFRYARDRLVASLLFCFCLLMMITFAVQAGADVESHGGVLSAISLIGSALALPSFAILSLVFPKNYWANRQGAARIFLFAYAGIFLLMGLLVSLYSVPLLILPVNPLPRWLDTVDLGYFLAGFICITLTLVISYRHAASLRQRQQRRLFVGAVILAFTPFVLLTLLPTIFGFKAILDARFSSIFIVLIPVALGYSTLRYQLIVFEVYVRRIVHAIVGVVGLAVIGYLVLTMESVFFGNDDSFGNIFIAFSLALLGAFYWKLAQIITDRFFFPEILHAQRIFARIPHEALSMEKASLLLTTAAASTLEVQPICLFIQNSDGILEPSPPLSPSGEDARQPLVSAVYERIPGSAAGWVHANDPRLDWLAESQRPLHLGELFQQDSSPDASRIITPYWYDDDPLLVAVRVEQQVIGILVLGKRGEHQQYAGADFELIAGLLGRFNSVLESAYLRMQDRTTQGVIMKLYDNTTHYLQSLPDIAHAYAVLIAETLRVGAAILLASDPDPSSGETGALTRALHPIARVGEVGLPDGLSIGSEQDWLPFYQDGLQETTGQAQASPTCLPALPPSHACAWLPLIGTQPVGILLLTYPHLHPFPELEKNILRMFAKQCAQALENAQMTQALQKAIERQKELDILKDQFIMTASHELRTPLTALQGYLELLCSYPKRFNLEQRTAFLTKASRSSDELTLLLNNIMDASFANEETKRLALAPVRLADSIAHMQEILEGTLLTEHRQLHIDVAHDPFVQADDLRLRQVLLNLLTNARKYSPVGSPLEVRSQTGTDETQVTISVRDYGLGVPTNAQEHLFERFYRLERELNSPVRGAGLGLSICKQLVEAMGGKIWVTSSGISGEGSEFSFTLTRAPAPDTLVDVSHPQGVSSGGNHASPRL